MSELLRFHAQLPHLALYIQHLCLDAIAGAGGYYASRFCSHLWHRLVVAAFFTILSTTLITTLVG